MRPAVICAALLALAACQRFEPRESPLDAATLTGAIVAAGDTPQWRLSADPSTGAMVLMLGDGTSFEAPYLPPEPTEDGAEIRGGEVHLALAPGPCSVGGVAYTMRATVQAQGQQALDGCATLRWDTHLLSLMPQIDACIAAAPENERWVRYAGEAAGGDMIVRFNTVDCTVASGLATQAQVTSRNESLRYAGEGEAIFVRGPGENPGGQCYAAPEVLGEEGELLGWMADPQGC
jgi:hypothetical protein